MPGPQPKPKPTAKPAAKPAAKAAAKQPAGKVAAKTAPAAKAAPAKQASKPAATASGNGVHIKGLTNESVADVKSMVANCGNVTDVRLRRNKFALVWFDNNAGATKAVQTFNGKNVNGKQLAVHGAKANASANKYANATTVFVSPIFRAMTNRKSVRTLFGDCGKITKLRTYAKNYAFVRFESASAAASAMKKNGATFMNKSLVVKASIRK